jgi:putative cell wall-binding protein
LTQAIKHIEEKLPLYVVGNHSILNFQFSDEEEETKRVVRSAKEKRYEDLTNIMKQIRNFKKIKDMSSMLSSKCNLLSCTWWFSMVYCKGL